MKAMYSIINGISDNLVKVVDKVASKSSMVDMRDYAARYTSDNICNVAFGLECDCELKLNITAN